MAKKEIDGEISLSASGKGSGELIASLTLMYSINKIKSLINSGEVGLALLLLSVRVENELSARIREHFDLSKENYEELGLDSQTLGWHLSKSNEHDLVAKEYRESLQNLLNERNSLVHDTGHLEMIDASESRRDEIEDLLSDVIEFLEQAE